MKSKVTKKQIIEATEVNSNYSTGSVRYSFETVINNVRFIKPYTSTVMSIEYCDKDGYPICENVHGIDYKKDFIQEVYNYLNS